MDVAQICMTQELLPFWFAFMSAGKWKLIGMLPVRHNECWLRCKTFTQKKNNITALMDALIPLETTLSASRLAVVQWLWIWMCLFWERATSYIMVWWSDWCSWWLFLLAQPRHICNNLEKCSVNMLSLTRSDLSKSERFQIKRSLVSTACRHRATRNSTLTRFLACSACKNYGVACWGFGASRDHFSCEHCGPIWSENKWPLHVKFVPDVVCNKTMQNWVLPNQ